MKQIKKLILQAVIMILLITMLFFAWQKLVKTKFLIKEAGSLQELKEEAEKNKPTSIEEWQKKHKKHKKQ